jgi:hypothetical protein
MTVTDASDVDNFACPGLDDRLHPFEGFRICADHAIQRPGPGFLRCATQRRIDELDPLCSKVVRDFDRNCRIAGRAVDNHRFGLQAAFHPLNGSRNFTGACQAQEDNRRTLCQFR